MATGTTSFSREHKTEYGQLFLYRLLAPSAASPSSSGNGPICTHADSITSAVRLKTKKNRFIIVLPSCAQLNQNLWSKQRRLERIPLLRGHHSRRHNEHNKRNLGNGFAEWARKLTDRSTSLPINAKPRACADGGCQPCGSCCVRILDGHSRVSAYANLARTSIP